MKKLKKIILYTVLSFVLLIGILIAIPFLFKGKIITLIKTEINKNIVYAKVDFSSADLSLISSFPDFRLTIHDLHIQNDSTFNHQELLYVKDINIDIDIMSVIKGKQYAINKVGLNALRFNALVLPDGKANYDIVKTDTTDKETPKTKDTAATTFNLLLKSFTIQDAHIVYEDKKGNNSYKLLALNYALSGDMSNEETDLAMNLGIDSTSVSHSGITYLNKAKFNLDINLGAQFKTQKYTIKKNVLKINALELQLKGWVQILKNAFDMDLALDISKISLKNILSLIPALYTKDFKDMVAKGETSLQAKAKGIYDSTRIPAFNVALQVHNGQFKYPSLPKTVDNIQIALNILNKDGKLDNTSIDLDKFHISLAENQADASLHLTKPISDPNVSAILKAKADLRSVKDFVPIKDLNLEGLLDADIEIAGTKSMVDKKQYQKFKATGNFTLNNIKYVASAFKNPVLVKEISLFLSPQKVQLKNLDANFGKSDIQMKGIITNFLDYFLGGKKELEGNFSLSANTLDLNEFMVSDTTKKTTENTAKTTKKTSSSVLEVPKNIHFNLHTNVQHILYDTWKIEGLSGKVGIQNQQASLSNLSFSLLDAAFLLNGNYSTVNPQKPKVGFNTKIDHLDIQKALAAFPIATKFTSYTKECYGNINCAIAFNTLLNDTMSPILSTLNANGTIKTKSVQFKGELTDKLTALINKKALENLNIKDLTLDFTIRNGILALQPFPLNLGPVNGLCQAKYDLDGKMDMNYNAQVPTALLQQLLTERFSEIAQLQQKAKENGLDLEHIIPENIGAIVNVKGPTNQPNFNITLDKNFGNELKKNIEQAVRKKLEQAKNHLIKEGQKEIERQKQKLLEEGKKKLKNILKF